MESESDHNTMSDECQQSSSAQTDIDKKRQTKLERGRRRRRRLYLKQQAQCMSEECREYRGKLRTPTVNRPTTTRTNHSQTREITENMPQQQDRTSASYNGNNLQTSQQQYQKTLHSFYPQYPQKQQQNLIAGNYPIHPDVRFKKLPFYDVLAEILKPSSLVPRSNERIQEGSFQFSLSPQQSSDIASSRDTRPGTCDYIKQVQLRFCLLETSCEQEDCFPPNILVKVNNRVCPLPNPIPTNKPGVEPKRPPRPVNITGMLKLSSAVNNHITVSWGTDFTRGYAISVSLVQKLSSQELLQRLKSKGSKNAEYTRALIKEKLNDDGDEIATTSLRVSLMCPLGKMRMSTPCRPMTCMHLQCFDASLFLQMNEKKPTWHCPVCDKPALYDDLRIDGYFTEVLNSAVLPSGCNEIQVNKDGTWSVQTTEKANQSVSKPTIISIDDSVVEVIDDIEIIGSDTNDAAPNPEASSSNKLKETAKVEESRKRDIVDLTISSSDDEEPPVKVRAVSPSQEVVSKPGVSTVSRAISPKPSISIFPRPISPKLDMSTGSRPISPKPGIYIPERVISPITIIPIPKDSTCPKPMTSTTSRAISPNLDSTIISRVTATDDPLSLSPASPEIIDLDSPSPPCSPPPTPQQAFEPSVSSAKIAGHDEETVIIPLTSMPFLDLENGTNTTCPKNLDA